MESKNVWQQILGKKNLGSKFFRMKIRGAKWGTFFFERNFLGRKFWEACFGGVDSFGEEILPAKFLENFLRVKKSFRGRKKLLGSKNVLEERYGEQKILRANFYL